MRQGASGIVVPPGSRAILRPRTWRSLTRLQRTAPLSFVLNSMSIGRAALRPGHTLLRSVDPI
jgi:hypothetical protein